MHPASASQDSNSLISGLQLGLELALAELAKEWGHEAPARLRLLRDDSLRRFKDSETSADGESGQAVANPKLEVIERVFNEAKWSTRPRSTCVALRSKKPRKAKNGYNPARIRYSTSLLA
jgi:hypothetical protein